MCWISTAGNNGLMHVKNKRMVPVIQHSRQLGSTTVWKLRTQSRYTKHVPVYPPSKQERVACIPEAPCEAHKNKPSYMCSQLQPMRYLGVAARPPISGGLPQHAQRITAVLARTSFEEQSWRQLSPRARALARQCNRTPSWAC